MFCTLHVCSVCLKFRKKQSVSGLVALYQCTYNGKQGCEFALVFVIYGSDLRVLLVFVFIDFTLHRLFFSWTAILTPRLASQMNTDQDPQPNQVPVVIVFDTGPGVVFMDILL